MYQNYLSLLHHLPERSTSHHQVFYILFHSQVGVFLLKKSNILPLAIPTNRVESQHPSTKSKKETRLLISQEHEVPVSVIENKMEC